MKSEPWFDSLWFRFLVGGTIIAGTSQIAAHVNPTLGAIFWSAPLTLVPTMLYFWNIKMPPKKVFIFAKDTVVSLLNLMAFAVTVAIAMNMKAFQNDNGIMYALVIGFAVWGVGSYFLYQYSKTTKNL